MLSPTYRDFRGSEILVTFDSAGVCDCLVTADQVSVNWISALKEKLSIHHWEGLRVDVIYIVWTVRTLMLAGPFDEKLKLLKR